MRLCSRNAIYHFGWCYTYSQVFSHLGSVKRTFASELAMLLTSHQSVQHLIGNAHNGGVFV